MRPNDGATRTHTARRARSRSRFVSAPLAALVLAATTATVASASSQEGGGGSTTTSSTTSTSTTTSTTAPPSEPSSPPTTSRPAEPGPAHDSDVATPPSGSPAEDAGPDEEPPAPVPVPPPTVVAGAPAPPPPGFDALALPVDPVLAIGEAELERARAQTRIAELQGQLFRLEHRLDALKGNKARAAERLRQTRDQLRIRAVEVYMRTPAADLTTILLSHDVNELGRRASVVAALAAADRERLAGYSEARSAVDGEVSRIIDDIGRNQAEMAAAMQQLQSSEGLVLARRAEATAISAGIVPWRSLHFPVGKPHAFSDTFGAPRMFGTAFAHLHQGTDIFAPSGTSLFAAERGVLAKVGTDRLGGTKLWLIGASGTRYYYAHLSGYAPDMADGVVVEAGQLVGFVGNTGNALTTPAHLHFEVHPPDSPAINPYHLLRFVDDFLPSGSGSAAAVAADRAPR